MHLRLYVCSVLNAAAIKLNFILITLMMHTRIYEYTPI